MRIAFAGNPNSGKTTMYNALTGRNEKIGNWGGVTIGSKEFKLKKDFAGDQEVIAVDLPGAYSMSPFTPEEGITSEYVRTANPDAIVNIVDATNLSRSLFFTTQLLELGILSAALGVTTLLYPERIMNVMAAALGLAVLTDGLFRIRIAQDARRFGLPKWGVILALAAAAVICGALLMLFPETGARTVTVFLGITLLADGLLNLWVTGSAVRIFREHRSEIVDADGTWKEAGEAR